MNTMPHVISADVGGTNSRFQLHSAPESADGAIYGHAEFALVFETVLASAEFTSLGEIVVRDE